jgi:hypothetical protein
MRIGAGGTRGVLGELLKERSSSTSNFELPPL